MKLGTDEVLKVPYKCCCVSTRSTQGSIKGRAKLCHGGPLFQRTSSSDRKATATNQMHSSDLGRSVNIFGGKTQFRIKRGIATKLKIVWMEFPLYDSIKE